MPQELASDELITRMVGLPPDIDRRIARAAETRGVSCDEIVREALARTFFLDDEIGHAAQDCYT